MVYHGTTILLTLPVLLQIVPGAVGRPAPAEDGSLCRDGACGAHTRGHGHWENVEICTPETVTVTAISTEQLPGPTETIAGPTDTVTVTADGPAKTATVTETLTSTVTDVSTSKQIVTHAETITVTVTSPGTATANTDTATPTPTTNGAGSNDGPDYGTCSDPTIRWADGLDGRTEYSWTTNNQNDFPHGSSTTLNTLLNFVCSHLRSPCNAPQATVNRCYSAAAQVSNSGLKGEKASDLWNSLMA
ncbi:hypothetical protein BDV32DRAFT_153983 [Aspergillus pseudonomiae]|nr:hypothetical protein BDV32DRAFT_153983 [Aspergillus pseudonomiae]